MRYLGLKHVSLAMCLALVVLAQPAFGQVTTLPDAVLEAVDKREASALGDLPTGTRLLLLGMIGSQSACDILRTDTGTGQTAKALAGLSLCRTDSDQDQLAALAAALLKGGKLDPAYAALLGAGGGAPIRAVLGDAINAIRAGNASALEPLLQGLMQSFAYDRIDVATLNGLTATDLLAIGLRGEAALGADYAALYALSRMQGLEAQLSVADLADGMIVAAKIKNPRHRGQILALLTRLLGGLRGDAAAAATAILIDIADEQRPGDVFEAARALAGGRGDRANKTLLQMTGEAELPAGVRVRALQSLGGVEGLDASMVEAIKTLTSDGSLWVAGTALDMLGRHDRDAAKAIAVSWLDEDSYLAIKGRNLLVGDEAGQSSLRLWVAQNKGDPRATRIERLLFPDTVPARAERPTPAAGKARSAAEQLVILTTDRGEIFIRMNPKAPMNAHNFVALVEARLMDDALFHRVIPNFVAQWGETEALGVLEWGTVRDNWLSGEHRYGTVGVATGGKDTGAAQFFINIFDNLHLTGRYTVVGHVIKGMDIAEKMQEGDRVISARVARAPKLFWE